ncbi:hypothetical protein [Sphingomonas ginsenosidivorax]|jgi:hypothetical protein|uniref:hypothetical protein n=1 Tax=Sphingomonas ginsenosidivorax TaxID=862135 RepID=UPI001315065D|nr:hypothetical protein [Sphingomonas ginsenosidivorax]
MQTFPKPNSLVVARDHLVRALDILDDSTELVIAARVADVIELLNAVLPAAGV